MRSLIASKNDVRCCGGVKEDGGGGDGEEVLVLVSLVSPPYFLRAERK
jgi:hypothetical protein